METAFQELIEQNKKHIDNKNQQTSYKIKYVTTYVENWLRVMSNAEYTKNLNFIDCMSNAGIYQDGDFCTAMEVLKLFKDYAEKFPHKNYCLYINDISKERLEIFKKVANVLFGDEVPKNILLYCNNNDVNDYIRILTTNDNLFTYPNATILYVDPYDFGTVHIPTLRSFANKYYCEIIFNVFTSDFVRNHMDKRISKAIDDKDVDIKTKEDLVDYIVSQLKVNKMKYSFQYEFRISTNVELYQIMFLTPSPKGLDELKNALWETFNGSSFYRNEKKSQNQNLQLSLFTEESDKEYKLNEYSNEAKSFLTQNFGGQTLSYEEICEHILPISMLRSSDIISHLLKPAIADGKIEKLNRVKSKLNYKNDFYKIN